MSCHAVLHSVAKLLMGCIHLNRCFIVSHEIHCAKHRLDVLNLDAWLMTDVRALCQQSTLLLTLWVVRRGTPDPKDESLAAHLMRVRDERGKLLPHTRQWSELSVFFYAGMETTAHTIAWCVPGMSV